MSKRKTWACVFGMCPRAKMTWTPPPPPPFSGVRNSLKPRALSAQRPGCVGSFGATKGCKAPNGNAVGRASRGRRGCRASAFPRPSCTSRSSVRHTKTEALLPEAVEVTRKTSSKRGGPQWGEGGEGGGGVRGAVGEGWVRGG